MPITASDIILNQTCYACPEQYDAYYNGREVGYLRLRHGNFTVEASAELVFQAYPKGDGLFDADERDEYLEEAKKRIAAYWNKREFEEYCEGL